MRYKSRWYGVSIDFPDGWERVRRYRFSILEGRKANFEAVDGRAILDFSLGRYNKRNPKHRQMKDGEARTSASVEMLKDKQSDVGERLYENITPVNDINIDGEDNVSYVRYQGRIAKPRSLSGGRKVVAKVHGGEIDVFRNNKFYSFQYKYFPDEETETHSAEKYEEMMQGIISSIRFLR